jgi:predicted phosphodiesterase
VARVRSWLNGPLVDRLRLVRRRISLRRIGRGILVGLLVLLPSLVWGVATATADANLGPHEARYEITLDHQVTVDFGPLGTLVIDAPLPLALGVRVEVKEIPREIAAVDAASTLDALGADLEGYVQFFTAPEATIEVVVRALVLDAARRTALAAVAIVVTTAGLRALLGSRRRAELTAALRPHRGLLAGGTATVLLVAGTVTGSLPVGPDASDAQRASAVFDGTPLEGARITGRLAGVIDTYGGYAVEAYRDNQRFYDDATASVRAAWGRQDTLMAEIARLHDGQRPPTSTPSVNEEPAPEPVVMVVISDVHCNVGMATVIRAVAELSGAQIVLNAGDSTVNGTGVESYCITALADAVPDGAVQVVSDGNHDSPETAAQERRSGARVLEGEVIEVAGVRILGDADPRATRIGAGTTQRGEETFEDAARRLADVACADPDGVDLLLVHDPLMGSAALEESCVPAQVSGHTHRRIGPVWVGHGTRFVSSSTAGASLGQATVGPLNGVAEITVVRFDPEARRIVDYRLVRVSPDAEGSVGAWLSWPGQPARPLPQGGPV